MYRKPIQEGTDKLNSNHPKILDVKLVTKLKHEKYIKIQYI